MKIYLNHFNCNRNENNDFLIAYKYVNDLIISWLSYLYRRVIRGAVVVFLLKGLWFGMFVVDIYGPEGRRGIAPTWNCTHIFKRLINLFVYIKLIFFVNNFLVYSLVDILGIKPAPGDHESNFKKVGAIPCWCNNKWTGREWESIIIYKSIFFDFSIFLPFQSKLNEKEKKDMVWL